MFERLILSTKKFSALAPHLVKLTGKSKEAIHPKHLINVEPIWFLKYIKKNYKILDVGCGNGQTDIKIASYCQEIIGLDKNLKMLEIARRECQGKKIKNIKFNFADLEKKMTLKKHYFDVILILDVLEHINKRLELLKECHRILGDKGYLFISIPNKNTSWKIKLKKAGLAYYSDPDHKIEYDKKSISKELMKSGFKIIESKPIIYDFSLVGLTDIIGGISLKIYTKIIKWKIDKVKKYPEDSTGFRIVCKKI